jgi:hypothetical protein
VALFTTLAASAYGVSKAFWLLCSVVCYGIGLACANARFFLTSVSLNQGENRMKNTTYLPENARSYNQKRGRIILIAIVLLFLIPAIAAQLILTQQWYQSGVTNKGILIVPRLTYSMLEVESKAEKGWHWGYVMPARCDETCEQQVHLLNQSYKALGKYQTRVSPVLFITSESDPIATERYKASIISISVSNIFNQSVKPSEYVLVDPLGQLVMKYPHQSKQKDLIRHHKEMLSDFRKLLKLSRVG